MYRGTGDWRNPFVKKTSAAQYKYSTILKLLSITLTWFANKTSSTSAHTVLSSDVSCLADPILLAMNLQKK